MLLSVNPDALFDKTNAGETLLQLATSSATKAHPNYALIDELNNKLAFPHARHHNDKNNMGQPILQARHQHHHRSHQAHPSHDHQHQMQEMEMGAAAAAAAAAVGRVSSEDDSSWNRDRLDSNESAKSWTSAYAVGFSEPLPPPPPEQPPALVTKTRSSRKRKANPDPAADLLLHFSRNSNGGSPRRGDVDDGGDGETEAGDVELDDHHYDDNSFVPSRVAEV